MKLLRFSAPLALTMLPLLAALMLGGCAGRSFLDPGHAQNVNQKYDNAAD